MSFTPTEAKFPIVDNISSAGGQAYSMSDYAHDEIVQQIQKNEQNITANADRVQANETELAAHDADIKELQKNNPVVELKDTVTESAETNSETHDIKETTSDGTENQIANFVLAQKQITKIETDTAANTMTVSAIDQTGVTSSETLNLPAGGGAAYDDTQVKADIATNKTAIEKNTADIATNKTAIEKNTADIAKISSLKNFFPDYSNPVNISGGPYTLTGDAYIYYILIASSATTDYDLTINGTDVTVASSSSTINSYIKSFSGYVKAGSVISFVSATQSLSTSNTKIYYL